MRGIIGTLIFGMAMSIGVAHAQVAVPTLNPISSFSGIGPISNPAAQQWGAPSRVVVGATSGTSESDDGTTTDDFDISGTRIGARVVGETLALGGEVKSAEITGDIGVFDVESVRSSADFAISGLIGDFLALGIGLQSQQETFEATVGSTTFADETTTQSMPVFGASLKIGDSIFLGGAAGMEKIVFEDNLDSTNDYDGERQVVRYGAGFRSSEGAFRAEYYVDIREPISVTIGTVDVDIEESVTTVASVEVVFANILLGVILANSEVDSGGDVLEISSTTASIGWVPMDGLTVVANLFSETDTNTSTTPDDTVRTTTLTTIAVGWMF